LKLVCKVVAKTKTRKNQLLFVNVSMNVELREYITFYWVCTNTGITGIAGITSEYRKIQITAYTKRVLPTL